MNIYGLDLELSSFTPNRLWVDNEDRRQESGVRFTTSRA